MATLEIPSPMTLERWFRKGWKRIGWRKSRCRHTGLNNTPIQIQTKWGSYLLQRGAKSTIKREARSISRKISLTSGSRPPPAKIKNSRITVVLEKKLILKRLMLSISNSTISWTIWNKKFQTWKKICWGKSRRNWRKNKKRKNREKREL